MEKFLAEHIWAVMAVCTVGGGVLKHYLLSDYRRLDAAIQPETCQQHREAMAKDWEARCDKCKQQFGHRLEDGDTCFDDLRRDIAALRKAQNIQIWTMAAVCQAINSLPGVKKPVDCSRLENAADALTEG